MNGGELRMNVAVLISKVEYFSVTESGVHNLLDLVWRFGHMTPKSAIM